MKTSRQEKSNLVKTLDSDRSVTRVVLATDDTFRIFLLREVYVPEPANGDSPPRAVAQESLVEEHRLITLRVDYDSGNR